MKTEKGKSLDLTGKVALVTGASRGIGAAVALKLSGLGASIVLNFKSNTNAAKKISSVISQAGGKVFLAQGDVSEPGGASSIIKKAIKKHPRLDILVNCAGIGDSGLLDSVDHATFKRMFDINVFGTLSMIKNAAPHFNPSGGRIVNMSSAIARRRSFGVSLYAASKAAVEAITRITAAELGEKRIAVNAVAPGPVETDMIRNQLNETVRQALVKRTPFGRLGQPQDIANVIAFLCSDECCWMTGQVIDLDGGFQ